MQLNEIFTETELEIYSRQFLVKGWGLKQQLALKNSTILFNIENEVAARYLIAAGIGRIILKSADLYSKLKGFELNSKLDLLSELDQLPTINMEISEESKNMDMILPGILIATKAIKSISNFT